MAIVKAHRYTGIVAVLISAIAWANPQLAGTAVEQASQSWWQAFSDHKVDALLQHTAANVTVIDGGDRLATGHEGLRALLRQSPRVKVTAQSKDLQTADNVAWRTVAIQQAGMEQTSYVLEIWQREQGTWRLTHHASTGILTSPLRPRPMPSQPVLDRPTN